MRKMPLLVDPFCCILCWKGRKIWTIFSGTVIMRVMFGILSSRRLSCYAWHRNVRDMIKKFLLNRPFREKGRFFMVCGDVLFYGFYGGV